MEELMRGILKHAFLKELDNLEKSITETIESMKDEDLNNVMNNSPDGLPEEVKNAYKMISFGAMQMKASAIQMRQYIQVAKQAVEKHM